MLQVQGQPTVSDNVEMLKEFFSRSKHRKKEISDRKKQVVLEIFRQGFLTKCPPSEFENIRKIYKRLLKRLEVDQKIYKIAKVALNVLNPNQDDEAIHDARSKDIATYLTTAILENNFQDLLVSDVTCGKISINDVLTFAVLNRTDELMHLVMNGFRDLNLAKFTFVKGVYKGLTFSQAYLLAAGDDPKKTLEFLEFIDVEDLLKPISKKAREWRRFNGYTPLHLFLELNIPIPPGCLEELRGPYTDWREILSYSLISLEDEEVNALTCLLKSDSPYKADQFSLFFDLGCPVDRFIDHRDLWECALNPPHQALMNALVANEVGDIPLKKLFDAGCLATIRQLLDKNPEFTINELEGDVARFNRFLDTSNEDVETSDEEREEPAKKKVNIGSSLEENRAQVLRGLCEAGAASHLYFLTLLIKNYSPKISDNGLLEQLWDAAVNCQERPNRNLMTVLSNLELFSSSFEEQLNYAYWETDNWEIDNKSARYVAYLAISGKINITLSIDGDNTETYLTRAIRKNDGRLVKCLLAERADPNQSIILNGEVRTPLSLLRRDEYEISTELIAAGVRIDAGKILCDNEEVSSLSYVLERLIAAHQFEDPMSDRICLFVKDVFNKHSPEILNCYLEDGLYQGKNPLQVLIENKIWNAVNALCRRKVDVGNLFQEGEFKGLSSLQAIFVLACREGVDLRHVRPDLDVTDGISEVTLGEVIKSAARAAHPDDFCRQIPPLNDDWFDEGTTALHLAILAGTVIPQEAIQDIREWPDLVFPISSPYKVEETGSALLFALEREGIASFPLLSRLIKSGAPLTRGCISKIFKVMADDAEDQNDDVLIEMLEALSSRKISLDRPFKDEQTLLEWFSEENNEKLCLSLISLGAGLVNGRQLNLALPSSINWMESYKLKQENISCIRKCEKFFRELRSRPLSTETFRWLSDQFPTLALLLLANSDLRIRNFKQIFSDLNVEFFDEAIIRSLIIHSGSPFLVAKFLFSCPEAGIKKSGSLFPVVAKKLGFDQSLAIITHVFSQIPASDPLRVSHLLTALIKKIGGKDLKTYFLDEIGTEEEYIIQGAERLSLSKDHLDYALRHPFVAQPDPHWNKKIINDDSNEFTPQQLDIIYSQAVKNEFLSILNQAAGASAELCQGGEDGLNDLLNPIDSRSLGAPKNVEERVKLYGQILHLLSHVIVYQKEALLNPESPSLDDEEILSLAEGLTLCIPRRLFESSRAYMSTVKGIKENYKDEWTASMARLRLNLVDILVSRTTEDPEHNTHALTSIIKGLGKRLALAGYDRDFEDPYRYTIDNGDVESKFFTMYSPYGIVAKTIADLKDPDMRTLYEKHWLDKEERPWEGSWIESNQSIVEDLKAKVVSLNPGRKLNEFLLEASEQNINLDFGEFTKALGISDPEQKNEALLGLLDEGFRKRALHEYLWNDVVDEDDEVVGSDVKAIPLYKTLREFGAIKLVN